MFYVKRGYSIRNNVKLCNGRRTTAHKTQTKMAKKQISEDYVLFKTAELLKQKGFDEPTIGYYIAETSQYMGQTFKRGEFAESISRVPWNHGIKETGVQHLAAPTVQMAVEWLRVRYGLFVTVKFDGCNGKTHPYYFTVQWVGEGEPTYAREKLNGLGRFLRYKTPSDAYRAAIDEVLTKII